MELSIASKGTRLGQCQTTTPEKNIGALSEEWQEKEYNRTMTCNTTWKWQFDKGEECDYDAGKEHNWNSESVAGRKNTARKQVVGQVEGTQTTWLGGNTGQCRGRANLVIRAVGLDTRTHPCFHE